jgi:hypothetical protein
MTPLPLLLLLAPPVPLHQQAFTLERPAEVVAAIDVSCAQCQWGVRGREAAVVAVAVDGRPSQHLVLTRGTRGEYRVLLGALGPGEHRLELAHDTSRSAPGAGGVRVESVRFESVAADDARHEALAHAPIVHTRKGTIDRFSDVPLVAWVETIPSGDGGRELRYSIVFSHEDGGTPLDRLMATWGRATDIEHVYSVELDAGGAVRGAVYQGKDHVMNAFTGRLEGQHPVLYVDTKNNMVSDRGSETPRIALVPQPFTLDRVSREAVMDANPWTYAVSVSEVRREGLVSDTAAPGSKRIPEPRRFAHLEACGNVSDARLAFDAGLPADDGTLAWHASDAGRSDFRVARSGCFRAAVALPAGRSVSDVRALRLRAHTRPPRGNEPPLVPGSGSARVDRVNLFYGLGPDDLPGPSLFQWTDGADLAPDGPPLELELPMSPQAERPLPEAVAVPAPEVPPSPVPVPAAPPPPVTPAQPAPVAVATPEPDSKRVVSLFPAGDIYPPYVADPHRTGNGAMVQFHTRTEIPETSGTRTMLKAGGRMGVARWDAAQPGGRSWQISLDAGFDAVFDSQNSLDNIGWDGNYGFTVTTASSSRLSYKVGILHCSAHIGDEYIERTGRTRLGYSREELAVGARYRLAPAWSGYAELGVAYHQLDDELQEPWRAQLGVDWQSQRPLFGGFAWYGALDLQMWQERDFNPDFTLQGGLAAAGAGRTWRFGVEYAYGRPPLGEFFQDTETRVTLGMWVEF